MKITVQTAEAQKGFYPTPPELAMDLLSGISWETVKDILEPSAGKGDLVNAIAERRVGHYLHLDRSDALQVDCIEIDPCLRTILLDSFGEKYENALSERIRELDSKDRRDDLSPTEKGEKALMEAERRKLRAVDVRVVCDDFLSFTSRKHYDLIVMNPPFADADLHLLKAISIAERYGSTVRCILNADTLRNPYTNRRKLLAQKLVELGAEIEFREGVFRDAERQTDVDVALVKLAVPAPQYANDPASLYQKLKAAAQLEEVDPEVTELTVGDRIAQIVAQFNLEVDAGLSLIREYRAMQPYILDSLDEKDKYRNPVLTLCVGDPSRVYRGKMPSVNKYLEAIRKKYWEAWFAREEYTGKLTSNLREKYQDMVSELVNYDFSEYNIQRIMLEMNAEMSQGVVDTILSLFDRMTEKHTWYPECEKNVHYFNGWKTNKAHKVNKKVILPTYGCWDHSYFSGRTELNVYNAYKFLSDIEKAFNYLDGNMSADVDLHAVLDMAKKREQFNKLHCKFFEVTFYKKGTAHIKFTNQELLDRFNIYCARQRGWLPPSYGNIKYTDMASEEQAVVDSYHGDDTPSSGEKAYDAVVARAGYYLAPPNQQTLSLPDAA